MVTDNSTASGIVNDTVKQKQSKAMDMRFYWTRDRVKQNQFCIYWKKGILNRADYFTKDHQVKHHKEMRSTYLHEAHLTYEAEVSYYYALDTQEGNDHAINHLDLFYATFASEDMFTIKSDLHTCTQDAADIVAKLWQGSAHS
jgi:hypothetical protein